MSRIKWKRVFLSVFSLVFTGILYIFLGKYFGFGLKAAYSSFLVSMLISLTTFNNPFFSFGWHLFFMVAAWSYFIEGRFFGEGMISHLSLNNIGILILFKLELLVTAIWLVGMFFLSNVQKKYDHLKDWKLRFSSLLLVLVLLVYSQAFDIVADVLSRRNEIVLNNVTLEGARQHLALKGIKKSLFPLVGSIEVKKKKDIILLFMESVEANYLDEKRFPGLTTFLNHHKSKSKSFNTFNQGSGGWTIAGVFSSMCGYPVELLNKKQLLGNDLFAYTDTRSITCLSDIFSRNGYENYFVQGSDIEFSGLKKFLREHSFNNITGSEVFEAKERNEFSAFDDYFFKEMLEQVKLHYQEKPKVPMFLSGINFDTHAPGIVSPNCRPLPEYKHDSIASAVYCFDNFLADFVSQMENLAVEHGREVFFVILNDHLSMTRFRHEEGRKNILLLSELGKNLSGSENSEIFHYDVPNILLTHLGAEVKDAFPYAFNFEEGRRRLNMNVNDLSSVSKLFEHSSKSQLNCEEPLEFYPASLEIKNGTFITKFTDNNGETPLLKEKLLVMLLDSGLNVLDAGIYRIQEVNYLLNSKYLETVSDVILIGRSDSSENIYFYKGPIEDRESDLAISTFEPTVLEGWCK